MTDIERISTWMISTRNHLSRVITQNQETVAMPSTAVSKRVFKSQTALKWRWTNVQCNVAFSWSGVYINIYISFKYPVRWQKLLGSARSGSTAMSFRNCVITMVSGWWGQSIACAFTRCMMKIQCWQVFFLLFLTRIVYLCHLSYIRTYASALIFLSSGQFVCVLPSFILRMVPNILQGKQPMSFSIW